MTNEHQNEIAYIGLGTNLGDRESNLREARNRIEALGLQIAAASSLYETEPVGYLDQPWFLNQAVKVSVEPDARFSSDPVRLLESLLNIESEMGRQRLINQGPRNIDIDLLFFDARVINWENSDESQMDERSVLLVLPHPRLHTRRFVLEPLNEVAQDLIHPVFKKTVRQLLKELPAGQVVRKYEKA